MSSEQQHTAQTADLLEVHELVTNTVDAHEATVTLTLPFQLRQKSRLRTRLDSGLEIALVLPRGRVLRHGDVLRAANGTLIEVKAAEEQVSTATTHDPLQLARACYHLGNRHVALQIGDRWLRYLHDHVLDDMVREQGLTITVERAPFEPEAGAYHAGHSLLHLHSHI